MDNSLDPNQDLHNQMDELKQSLSALQAKVDKQEKSDETISVHRIPQGAGSGLDSDKVDGIGASYLPMPFNLTPLGANGKFPASVIPTSGSGAGFLLGNGAPTDKNVLIADGSLWQSRTMGGDATITADTGTLTLATSGVSAGTYGDSTHIPSVTVDAKGRVTTASQSAFSSGDFTLVSSSTYTTNQTSISISVPDANQAYMLVWDFRIKVQSNNLRLTFNNDSSQSYEYEAFGNKVGTGFVANNTNGTYYDLGGRAVVADTDSQFTGHLTIRPSPYAVALSTNQIFGASRYTQSGNIVFVSLFGFYNNTGSAIATIEIFGGGSLAFLGSYWLYKIHSA